LVVDITKIKFKKIEDTEKREENKNQSYAKRFKTLRSSRTDDSKNEKSCQADSDYKKENEPPKVIQEVHQSSNHTQQLS